MYFLKIYPLVSKIQNSIYNVIMNSIKDKLYYIKLKKINFANNKIELIRCHITYITNMLLLNILQVSCMKKILFYLCYYSFCFYRIVLSCVILFWFSLYNILMTVFFIPLLRSVTSVLLV